MTTLVLLPGMDGTGELFSPFADAVEAKTRIVRYPASPPLAYAELEAFAAAELPADEPYVLLGESFSGPIALSIAAKQPPQLRGIVLCCSFARNPRPIPALLSGLVNRLPDRPPVGLLLWFLAGRFATPELRQALTRALAKIPPATLRARMAAVLGINVVSLPPSLSVPLLYLRAVEDRVVPATASRLILEHVPNGRVVDFVAPHFLLQTVPREAASVVDEFVREAGSAR
ncbi:MAG: lysophospholipase [Betaproteobacteria bacterium]|nr:lysophospholipase [Betaproteobacteria bacterium]MCL2887398.1 lysophospholipase [Betaproteobacteria bacterium]